MIVKVCGVRDPEIACVAVDSGADWLGLVFEPRSPRHVTDVQARSVMEAVRGRAGLIGVFVQPSLAACAEAAGRYRLAAVQVHGGVDADFALRSPVPVIPGINVSGPEDAFTIDWWPDCLVLLDAAAGAGELPGGTGRRLDLDVAAQVARHRRVILAGGLDADTVTAAVQRVRPEGVDASSGLEDRPGHKDPERVERFVRAARSAADAAPP